jgi:predicted dehydrogenase
MKAGAVEDKLFLPGFQKLAKLLQSGFFGSIIGFRLEFGWWVFDGTEIPCQRPSWNYQRVGGGGLGFDMYPHWRYLHCSLNPRWEATMSVADEPLRAAQGDHQPSWPRDCHRHPRACDRANAAAQCPFGGY